MKRLVFLYGIVCAAIATGCTIKDDNAIAEVNTVTSQVDQAIQGTWVGVTGDNNADTLSLTLDNGALTLVFNEDSQSYTISSSYQVQSVASTMFVLDLFGFSDESYEQALDTVVFDLTEADRVKFYPEDTPDDFIYLYRQ